MAVAEEQITGVLYNASFRVESRSFCKRRIHKKTHFVEILQILFWNI